MEENWSIADFDESHGYRPTDGTANSELTNCIFARLSFFRAENHGGKIDGTVIGVRFYKGVPIPNSITD